MPNIKLLIGSFMARERRQRKRLSSVEKSFTSFRLPFFIEPLPGVLGNTGTGAFILGGTGDILKLFSENKELIRL